MTDDLDPSERQRQREEEREVRRAERAERRASRPERKHKGKPKTRSVGGIGGVRFIYKGRRVHP